MTDNAFTHHYAMIGSIPHTIEYGMPYGHMTISYDHLVYFFDCLVYGFETKAYHMVGIHTCST